MKGRVFRLHHLRIIAGRFCRALPAGLGRQALLRLERAIPDLMMVFDADFYLRANDDVADSGEDPLRHYILHGSREGRDPSPLFDTRYYMEQVNIPVSFPFSPLAHFLLIGRKMRLSPSPWFDFSFYERHNPELMTRRMCPYLHFLRHGLWQNRQASTLFDPVAYLREHREVPGGMPALLHFLERQLIGRRRETEAGRPLIHVSHALQMEHGLADIEAALRALPVAELVENPQVHVILPVYSGFNTTLRTLYTALTSRNETPWALTVINDSSPDTRLASVLRDLAARLGFRLVEHEENVGFVRTVNEGVQLHPHLDVVLLNADTEVYNDWLDRLRDAAYARDDVATVTPLSNNATICSYPVFMQNNVPLLELPFDELDRLAAEVNAGISVEAPTGVGFCMYITRKALDAVGLFDAETFGRGYGEENDFCQRAEKQGFVNLLAVDVFVRHVGGVSFGSDKRRLMKNALEAMNRKHPGYNARVREFIRCDPLRRARENLDLARLKRLRKERNVAFLGVTRGGGAELAMHRHMWREKEAGSSVLALVPTGEGSRVHVMHMEAGEFLNLPALDLDTQREEVARLLRELQINVLEIHHLIELSGEAPRSVRELCEACDIPYNFHVHDYLAICPRINLIDDSGIYCGEIGKGQCQSCLKRFSFKGKPVDINRWQGEYGALLRGAARVLAPSEDVRRRLIRYFPEVFIEVAPYEPSVQARLHQLERKPGAPLHIAVLGAVGVPKGINVLLGLARYIRKKHLPVRLSVIGYTCMNAELRRLGVYITGPYSDDHVQTLITEVNPDCILLPSVWPETYNFALSHALRSGRPVAAFDLGAIAERLRHLPQGLLMPLSWYDKPQRILDRLSAWTDELWSSKTSQ